MNKKAQQITFTIMFFVFIFSLIVTLFFDELLVNTKLDDQRQEYLQREATRAINILASEGYPTTWNEGNVQRAGLITNNHYDKNKFEELEKLSYSELKEALFLSHNFLLVIDEYQKGETIQEIMYTETTLLKAKPAYLATQTKRITDEEGTLHTITIHLYRGIS